MDSIPPMKCNRCSISDTAIDSEKDLCLWCVINDLKKEIEYWKDETFKVRTKFYIFHNEMILLQRKLNKEFEKLGKR
jgi:hypothetical protein